jgi:uncharacterized protein
LSEEQELAAGDFSPWLREIVQVIGGERGSDVPCAGCTACCRSSQFVHVEPDETDTLAHIPAELLFPAPRLPRGHLLLGYDERGHCPMLVDDACSIYEHRPRACRAYDCRVFAAAGIELDDPGRAELAQRARRWRFGFSTDDDRARYGAVRAAARFLAEHPDSGSNGATGSDLGRAVVAIEVHDVFLRRDERTGRSRVVDPDPHVVRVELTRRRGHADADADSGRIRSRP